MPENEQKWSDIHLKSTAIGYDTLLPGKPFFFDGGCGVEGVNGAIRNRDGFGLACIVVKRANFYFGSYSYVTYHNGDLPFRIFSLSLLSLFLAGFIFFVIAIAKLIKQDKYEAVFIAIFILSYVGQSLLIIPEQRFMVVPQVLFLWGLSGNVVNLSPRICQWTDMHRFSWV